MEPAASTDRSELRKTSLNALHRRLGAKMVNFGGWDMPGEYPSSGGVIAEHKAVRGSVGVFDVRHMGDIRNPRGAQRGGGLWGGQEISMDEAAKVVMWQEHICASVC